MSVTIATSLVATGDPASVRVVIDGIAEGDEYTVLGLVGDQIWRVPGGVGVGTGGSLVLLDNRAALNVGVRYRVLTGGEARESAPITVPSAAPVVLQSLGGDVVLRPVTVEAGTFDVELTVRSVAYDVPGRARAPVYSAPGGDGGGSFSIVTDAAGTTALRSLARGGRPVVLRCGQRIRDLPLVDLMMLSEVAGESVGGSWRRWRLSYLLVDDPQPSVVLSPFSWDDFDEAMATRTWDDFDAMFAGSTWDEFDTYPWRQL